MPSKKNFWNVVQQSIGFLVLYIPYNSSQNLQSRIMSEDGFGNLGFYNLAAVQLTAIFSTFISTSVISKVGPRVSHCIGTIGISLWIISSVFPALKKDQQDPYKKDHDFIYSDGFIYTVNILCSAICGFVSAILWTVQGFYTADCSTDKTKGFNFSLFWAFYMSSQIFGNLIGAFVLGNLDEEIFFYIMTAIAFSSILIFATLRNPEPAQIQADSIIAAVQHKTLTDSNIPTSLVVNHQPKSVFIMAKEIVTCMISKRMLLFLPQLGWTGITLAYYSGMLVLMMTTVLEPTDPDSQSQYKKALIAMIAFGFGEISGGPCVGYVVDKFSTKAGCYVNLIVIVIMTLVTVAFLVIYEFSWLAFVMTFMWGFNDGTTNTHSQGMLGFEFDNNSDPFAVYTCVQAVLCFAFQLIQTQIVGKTSFIIYTIVIGILGIFCCGSTCFFDFKLKAGKVEESPESTLLEEDQ